MKRILILGGGVGGTLTANLLVKKLRRRIEAGEVTITVVDQTGQHVYQPGSCTSPWAASGPPTCSGRSGPARRRGHARRGRGRGGRRATRSVHLADGERLAYDYLVLATGSRIVPEAIEHFDDRGAALLHGGGRAELRGRSTRSAAAGS